MGLVSDSETETWAEEGSLRVGKINREEVTAALLSHPRWLGTCHHVGCLHYAREYNDYPDHEWDDLEDELDGREIRNITTMPLPTELTLSCFNPAAHNIWTGSSYKRHCVYWTTTHAANNSFIHHASSNTSHDTLIYKIWTSCNNDDNPLWHKNQAGLLFHFRVISKWLIPSYEWRVWNTYF